MNSSGGINGCRWWFLLLRNESHSLAVGFGQVSDTCRRMWEIPVEVKKKKYQVSQNIPSLVSFSQWTGTTDLILEVKLVLKSCWGEPSRQKGASIICVQIMVICFLMIIPDPYRHLYCLTSATVYSIASLYTTAAGFSPSKPMSTSVPLCSFTTILVFLTKNKTDSFVIQHCWRFKTFKNCSFIYREQKWMVFLVTEAAGFQICVFFFWQSRFLV